MTAELAGLAELVVRHTQMIVYPFFEGCGLQPVRKPRKINRALAPEGMPVCWPQPLQGAENGFNH